MAAEETGPVVALTAGVICVLTVLFLLGNTAGKTATCRDVKRLLWVSNQSVAVETLVRNKVCR